jgi:hypothetical protein
VGDDRRPPDEYRWARQVSALALIAVVVVIVVLDVVVDGYDVSLPVLVPLLSPPLASCRSTCRGYVPDGLPLALRHPRRTSPH